ncbi:DUF2934 domain-containing protein [Bradyrhizobium sp. th.b2]|uniref:DUF2934 domain-containing protein n=1 Tax=Bradyrhizobium sp. th-b2 TaxID=172088 RepID=UPI000A0683FC|nr:DUF2934 domain-containing protein [Bradyrhizobium sp. th.b2]
MRTLTEEDIRTRAYKLWKAAGGSTKCDAFWYQAEKELLAERARENSGLRASNVEPLDDGAIWSRRAVTSPDAPSHHLNDPAVVRSPRCMQRYSHGSR